MNKTSCRIGAFPADHTTFGGILLVSDFNTSCQGNGYAKGSRIARRIISDQNLDRQCGRNIETRKQYLDRQCKSNAETTTQFM